MSLEVPTSKFFSIEDTDSKTSITIPSLSKKGEKPILYLMIFFWTVGTALMTVEILNEINSMIVALLSGEIQNYFSVFMESKFFPNIYILVFAIIMYYAWWSLFIGFIWYLVGYEQWEITQSNVLIQRKAWIFKLERIYKFNSLEEIAVELPDKPYLKQGLGHWDGPIKIITNGEMIKCGRDLFEDDAEKIVNFLKAKYTLLDS